MMHEWRRNGHNLGGEGRQVEEEEEIGVDRWTCHFLFSIRMI
jgi:hypothetical protein